MEKLRKPNWRLTARDRIIVIVVSSILSKENCVFKNLELGIGFAVRDKVRNAVVRWKSLNEKLCWIRPKARFYKIISEDATENDQHYPRLRHESGIRSF